MKITKREIFSKTKEQLLKFGYDYLTFTTLSQELNVTRAALYKYYKNKDELIIDLMIQEMSQFLKELEILKNGENNTELLREVLVKMSQFSELHRLLESVFRIDYKNRQNYQDKMNILQNDHLLFNQYLNDIIEKCQLSGTLTKELDRSFIISFLSNIVNILGDDKDQNRLDQLEHVLLHGIGTNY